MQVRCAPAPVDAAGLDVTSSSFLLNEDEFIPYISKNSFATVSGACRSARLATLFLRRVSYPAIVGCLRPDGPWRGIWIRLKGAAWCAPDGLQLPGLLLAALPDRAPKWLRLVLQITRSFLGAPHRTGLSLLDFKCHPTAHCPPTTRPLPANRHYFDSLWQALSTDRAYDRQW